jgi:hypothetical protein
VIALAREYGPDGPGRHPERAAAPPPRPTAGRRLSRTAAAVALAGFTAVGLRTLLS